MCSVAEPCKPPSPCRHVGRAVEVKKSEGNLASYYSNEYKYEKSRLSVFDGQVCKHWETKKLLFPFAIGIFSKF